MRQTVHILLSIVTGILLTSTQSQANDSAVTIAAGGIIFERNEDIRIASEDLYISPDLVNVDYIFENTSDQDVTVQVGFPLPPVFADDMVDRAPGLDNGGTYVDFQTTVNGKPVHATESIDILDLDGNQITRLFQKENFPVKPHAPFYLRDFYDANNPQATRIKKRMRELGLLGNFESLKWKIRITYLWEHTFKANETTRVHHSYRPLRGGFIFTPDIDNPGAEMSFAQWFQNAFCADTVTWEKMVAVTTDTPSPAVAEIGYTLTTGANWSGPIGTFRLTIDTVAPQNILSVCWPYPFKEEGNTKHVFTARNFVPKQDILIAIMQTPTTTE